MLLTKDHARKVRRKRADLMLTKKATAQILGIKSQTLNKVEQGDYDAPRRIYESVMNWLLEDL
ncbi:TPA: XRE family transcriptional regulator [Streptococcus pyogenes]|uniref:XRE family transcriptional regulator n=1 Tax=Streptococcus pyogenes TaxID=1314 RepID=UPI000E02E05D|nr:XRE family transcriptional regulator [Streptococcus pyogenes]SUO76263.1 transcriptional regulator [Streptococcus pyogenes]HEP1340268.1 XRE family transcriptional regulator [Streptococcus pyogenes]HEP1375010.1 XRE family transcriptional regulator [Streptococcus pyogenes]HEQ7066650.1 XRE family transcriptional regulator [Streptococcus pyogenes]HER2937270.1 XRE family transcriptional regulator [Streptococcus pyogenes]